jgi:Protein of unknown function (DUF3800)
VLVGYFDGSYESETKSKIIAVCGFVAPRELWEKFNIAWNAVLQNQKWPSRLKRFHAFDCAFGFGEFEGWGFAERLAIWGEFVDVILNARLIAVGSILVREHFDALEEAVKARMGQPYHLPVEHCIQVSILISREEMDSEKIELLFDVENKLFAEESFARYRNYQADKKWNAEWVAVRQASSYEFAPLQAADLLAYASYRVHLEHFYPSNDEPYFPILPPFKNLIDGIETKGGIYEVQALAVLAKQIKQTL